MVSFAPVFSIGAFFIILGLITMGIGIVNDFINNRV
jgi:hypothetical protein